MLFSFASNLFPPKESSNSIIEEKTKLTANQNGNENGNVPPLKAPKNITISSTTINDTTTKSTDTSSNRMKLSPECVDIINNTDGLIDLPTDNSKLPIKAPKIINSIGRKSADLAEVVTIDVVQRISPANSTGNLAYNTLDEIQNVVEEIVTNAINIQTKSMTVINTMIIVSGITEDIISTAIQDVTDKPISFIAEKEIGEKEIEEKEIDSTPSNAGTIEPENTQTLLTDEIVISKSNNGFNKIDVKTDVSTLAHEDNNFILVQGQYNNGKLNGECICKFDNGDLYQGEYLDGKKNGVGKYTFSDKSYYYGSYRNDMRHGLGEFVFSNGEKYCGCFYNDKFDGKGSYHFVDTGNEKLYEGKFIDGYFHGYGTMTYFNGDILEGEWMYDNCHGNGLMKYNNGDVYDGEFNLGQKCGKGMTIFDNGHTYEGFYQKNKMNGFGTYTDDNGIIYEGNFVDNKKQGKGILTFPSGDVVEGEFFNNNLNGYSVFKYSNNDIFQGIFSDNEKVQGKYIYHSGNIFIGDFTNNEKFKGTFFFAKTGRLYDGEFLNKKLVKFVRLGNN